MFQVNQRSNKPFHCSLNNKALDTCFSKDCPHQAFRCHVEGCECWNKNHSKCQLIVLNPLIQQLKQKRNDASNENIKTIKEVSSIFKEIIKKLEADLAEILNRLEYAGLQKNQAQMMKLIEQGRHEQINGDLVYHAKMESIKSPQQLKKTSIKHCTQKEVQERWETQKIKFEELRSTLEELSMPKQSDKLWSNQEKLIKKFLGAPAAKFKLLYRASENNYSVTEFHKKCDNIPNTLVIARTQFGKVIGGYTPLTWNAVNGNYAPDSTSKSFLFSLTNNEKYPITNTSAAIYCHPNYGPAFGNGCDLCIHDNSHTAQNKSHANFPHSYNNGYTNNQDSKRAFSGATNNNYCKIKEWQVYSVQLS